MKKTFTRDLELVRVMRQGGVLFLAGTDGPDPYVFPGFSLHQELELMVRAGATPLQALQAATYHPAMFFAKLEEFGVVEKGRVADLVLLEGNPLEDIRNTRRIAAVVLHGRYFSREDLDQMLAQVEARAKQ
jgi:imidazolonepropionase-like amidohydrolase